MTASHNAKANVPTGGAIASGIPPIIKAGTATSGRQASGSARIYLPMPSAPPVAVPTFEDFLRSMPGWKRMYYQRGSEPGIMWIYRIDEHGNLIDSRITRSDDTT
jgi:hypothetical protein